MAVIAAASEPTPGSVDASAVSGGRGPHSGRSQRSRCSGVPTSSRGRAKKPADVIRLPMPAQPQLQLLLDDAAGEHVADAAAADLLGQHERGQPDLGRAGHHLERRDDVGLVDLGGDRADLGAGEVARKRLDLALLVAQAGAVRRGNRHRGKQRIRVECAGFPEGWQSG